MQQKKRQVLKLVMELNILARDLLLKNNFIDNQQHHFKTEKGDITLSINDRILFLKNDVDMNVSNGDFATITAINPKNITAILNNKKEVTIDASSYKHFTHGYAATIHKTQGVSVDHVKMLAS